MDSVLLILLLSLGGFMVHIGDASTAVHVASSPRHLQKKYAESTINNSRVGFRWWTSRREKNQTFVLHKNEYNNTAAGKKRTKKGRKKKGGWLARFSLKEKRRIKRITEVVRFVMNETEVAGPKLKVTPSVVKKMKHRLQAVMSSSFLDHEEWKRRLQERSDQFMDRVALISSWLLWKQEEALEEAMAEEEERADVDPNAVTEQSDLTRLPARSFHVVTTAALPWYTGTAINPLLRAGYLYQAMLEQQQKWKEEQWASGKVTAQVSVVRNCTIERSESRAGSDGVSVTLVVPWLELQEDQKQLYHCQFSSSAEQEEFIRNWLREHAGLPDAADGLEILFYPARYHRGLLSIFAMGDMISDVILKHNKTDLDVCILEEPEHCNWYRAPGDGWTQQFQYVVGIIHTNYKEYAATSHYSGLWTAPALAMICSAMVRAYCHKVIKLSDTLQTFCPGKEVTSNVHGVREEFWKKGLQLANLLREQEDNNADSLLMEPRVYFLGKLLWAKGLDILLELQHYYKQCTGSYFGIDIYGSGPDSGEIQKAFLKKTGSKKMVTTASASSVIESWTAVPFLASSSVFLSSLGNNLQFLAMQHWWNLKNSMDMYKTLSLPQMLRRQQQRPIPAEFLGRVDHAHLPRNYTIFVNPSISEVLCTATAEALAMGKFAIIPYHPSNYWFLQFPNCLPYRSKLEFVANLRWAMSHNPKPLTEEQAREFSWQAATERLFKAAAMTHAEALSAMDVGSILEGERIAWLHNEVFGKGSRGDVIRKILGAGPASEQVRYQQESAQKISAADEGSQEDQDDDNEGLGKGFSQSWFARAIQKTWKDIAKSTVS